jgi:hypothetical protein
LIIIEGPDGGGKTSLAARLNEEWHIPLQKRVVSHEAEALVPVDRYISDELQKGFGWRLYDRFGLISSPCYAMLPNRTFSGDMFDYMWLRGAYTMMDQLNPVVIYCIPPMEVVKANVMGDPHNVVIEPHIETIYINYLASAARGLHMNQMIWDYTDPWNEHRIDNLLGWAKARIEKGR